MKNTIRIILEVMVEMINSVGRFIDNNLLNLATMLNTILPYMMYFIGQYMCVHNDGTYNIGFELFIPIVTCIIIYLLRSYANKIRKGISIPVPSKRFTEIEDDGEVTVKNDQVQEIILYLADLEDWLEKKGLL